MKLLFRFLALSLFGFILIGCNSLKVTSDIKADADFSSYKTFKVVHFVDAKALEEKKFTVNQLNKDRVESAIAKEAGFRGMEEVEEPEVLLLWMTDVDIEKYYTTHTNYTGGNYWGYRGRYHGGYGMGSSYSSTQTHKAIMGKLTIALVDKKTEKLLWYAQGEKEVSGKQNDAERRIQDAVNQIMKSFPVNLK